MANNPSIKKWTDIRGMADAIGKDTVTIANEQTLIIERHAGDIISFS